MKTFLAGLFGGHSTVLYVIFAALMGGLYLEYKDTQADIIKIEAERDEWKSTALGHQNALITQSRQTARRATSSKEAANAAESIQTVPDAQHCGASEPIRVSLDWLSDYRARRAKPDTDPTNVPLPRQAELANPAKRR